MCESVGQANLLSDKFACKQSREVIDLPLTCHQSPRLSTFASRSSEVRRLLYYLYHYGGTDPLGMLACFLKKTADVMAPRLSVVFQRLVRPCSFLACCRQANGTPIPKGPPSSTVANYRPISKTSVLSIKVCECLVSVSLGICSSCASNHPGCYRYRKRLGTCDAL